MIRDPIKYQDDTELYSVQLPNELKDGGGDMVCRDGRILMELLCAAIRLDCGSRCDGHIEAEDNAAQTLEHFFHLRLRSDRLGNRLLRRTGLQQGRERVVDPHCQRQCGTREMDAVALILIR